MRISLALGVLVVALACGGGPATEAVSETVPVPVPEPETPAPAEPEPLVRAPWAEELLGPQGDEFAPLTCGEIVVSEELLWTVEGIRQYRDGATTYVSLPGEPSRRCGEVSGPAARIEVWPAGGTPYGWDVVAAAAHDALGDDWGFEVLGPPAKNARTGVEVLFTKSGADLATRIDKKLSEDGVLVKRREWNEAPSPVVLAVGSGVGPADRPAVSRLSLHGNTPVLAWSPAGNRLLTNSAYNDVFGELGEGIEETRGAWVVEALTGSARRLTGERAWHPMWVGSDQVAYVVPGEGLWIGHWAGEQGPHEGLASTESYSGQLFPFGVAPGPGQTVSMYLDWGVDAPGWYRFDPNDGSLILVEGFDTGMGDPRWVAPSRMVDTQCHQRTDNAQIMRDGSRFSVLTGDANFQIPGTPLHRYRHDPYTWFCDEFPEQCGFIEPCLSPDGAYVAWVSEGARPDQYDVNVMSLKEAP